MLNDDALTADDVAEMLQVSRSSVYKLVKADELASYHVGRKMRFTAADVENYIARSKQAKAQSVAASKAGAGYALGTRPRAAQAPAPAHVSRPAPAAPASPADSYVLAGNDVVGDVIANYLGAAGLPLGRVYEGSYTALVDLYQGAAHAALTHLFDASTSTYNVEAVKRLVPGTPVRVVRLVRRRQGLIVAKGNPKGLRSWDDLLQPGVRLVNRQRGSGSRILLDEQLAARGADRASIEGYGREAVSALAMASFVARGAADVGIGAERVFHQVEGVDFLPLQDEWLDLALSTAPECLRVADTITQLVRSRPFRTEVGAIVGYDASSMGKVVYEA